MASSRENQSRIPRPKSTSGNSKMPRTEARAQPIKSPASRTYEQKNVRPQEHGRRVQSNQPSAVVSPTVRSSGLPVSVQIRTVAVSPAANISINSKKFCHLLSMLTRMLEPKERSREFLIKAVHRFEEAKIGYLLNRGVDQSFPLVEDVVHSIQMRLPAVEWDDTRKAELIGKILGDMGEHKMAEEFQSFELELAAKDKTVPIAFPPIMLAPNAIDVKLDKAILIASEQLGTDWKFFFRHLGLEERHINEIVQARDSIPSMCSQAFAVWKRKYGTGATMLLLLKGLLVTNSFGVAERIVNELNLKEHRNLLEDHLTATVGGSILHTSRSSSVTQCDSVDCKAKLHGTKEQRVKPTSRQNVETPAMKQCPEVLSQEDVFVNVARTSQSDSVHICHADHDRPTVEILAGREQYPSVTPMLDPRSSVTAVNDAAESLENVRQTRASASFALLTSGAESESGSRRRIDPAKKNREMRNLASPDPEEPANLHDLAADAEKLIPKSSRNRHIQLIAAGQTGMGKTKTMNRTFGTMAKEGKPSKGSVTENVVTYTREFGRDHGATVPFKLSFTDTPGLGDSKMRFTDNSICNAIRQAIMPDATVFLLYFFKLGGSKPNSYHLQAIEMLERITRQSISAVVLTHATKKPDIGEFSGPGDVDVPDLFEKLRAKISTDRKTPKALLAEYVENAREEEEDINPSDLQIFGEDAEGSPWKRKTKSEFLQLNERKRTRKKTKKWFRKRLKRPKLPVFKIENSPLYRNQRGKFGILQFHSKLGRVVEERAERLALVFSLMTRDAVRTALPTLTETVSYTMKQWRICRSFELHFL